MREVEWEFTSFRVTIGWPQSDHLRIEVKVRREDWLTHGGSYSFDIDEALIQDELVYLELKKLIQTSWEAGKEYEKFYTLPGNPK